jgi:hypothetical protein
VRVKSGRRNFAQKLPENSGETDCPVGKIRCWR